MPKVTTLVPAITLVLAGLVAGGMVYASWAQAPGAPPGLPPVGSAYQPPGSLPEVPGALPAPAFLSHEELAQVSRVSVAAARQLTKPLYVDVRSPESYRTGHLPGAIWVNGHEIDRHLDQLPRDRELVFYCT